MELAIPITRFDPSNVRWGVPRDGAFRRIIPFGYEENQIKFNNLILVLEPLKITEIDKIKNQIVLEESKKFQYLSKIEELQLNIINELESNTCKWIDKSNVSETLRSPLQPWIKSKKLTVYLSPEPVSLQFFTENSLSIFSERSIQPGDTIRAVIKIQGLSLQMTGDDIWTGKSRIQHQILQIYKFSATTN